MNTHPASVRHHPTQSSAKSISTRNNPKPIEAMLFMLPGIDASEAQAFRRWAIDAGLVNTIRGDGVRALTTKEFSQSVPGGLRRNAHIFVNGHGKVSGQSHTLCIDADNEISEKSSDLMEALRKIPRAGLAADATLEESITVHMLGCEIGALRKEIRPDQALWARGTFLMYGSKKNSDSKDQLPCMEAALRYLGLCKKNPNTYEPLALFEAVASQRSNCISIAGGALTSPVVAHAPHVLRDIMSPLFQIDTAADPDVIQDKRISGSALSLQNLVQIESTRLSTTSHSIYPENEQIVRLLTNCIQRGDLNTMTEILAQRPDLLNAKDNQENSLLIWAISLAKPEITKFLIKHARVINESGAEGLTPLHHAADSNDVKSIKLLLNDDQPGMRAELDRRDDNGDTPLALALRENAVNAATCLIYAGANVHLANHEGETPVMLAAEHGNLYLVKLILKFNPDLSAKDEDGETALDKAKSNKHDLLAQVLEKITDSLTVTASQPAPLSNQTQHDASDH